MKIKGYKICVYISIYKVQLLIKSSIYWEVILNSLSNNAKLNSLHFNCKELTQLLSHCMVYANESKVPHSERVMPFHWYRLEHLRHKFLHPEKCGTPLSLSKDTSQLLPTSCPG